MVVGGTAATVCAGGGYTQGAGHSAFAPVFGLAADNTLREYDPLMLFSVALTAKFCRIRDRARQWLVRDR